MSFVLTITKRFTKAGKIKHYLFECPTFWRIEPAFECPQCGSKYRCYWDGNDIGGKINICNKCADEFQVKKSWTGIGGVK